MLGLSTLILLVCSIECYHKAHLKKQHPVVLPQAEAKAIHGADTLRRRARHFISKDATGKDILMTWVGGSYFATVTVGSQNQKFEMLIDTGSSNAVIPAVGCVGCGNQPLFDPSKSTSFKDIDVKSDFCQRCVPPLPAQAKAGAFAPVNGGLSHGSATNATCIWGTPYAKPGTTKCGFNGNYGSASSGVSGYLGSEIINVEGSGPVRTTLWIQEENIPAGAVPILGVASPLLTCGPTCFNNVVDDMIYQGVIESDYLGVCLESTGGVLEIGGYNTSLIEGNITWLQPDIESWYNVKIVAMYVGPYKLDVPEYLWRYSPDTIGSFLDSGTSVIILSQLPYQLLNQTFVEHYCPQIPSACPPYNFLTTCIDTAGQPCVNVSRSEMMKYPNITFGIEDINGNEAKFTLPPQQYFLHVGGDQYQTALLYIGGPGLVLGVPFMSNFYIIQDRTTWRTGIAQKKMSCL